MIFDLGCCCASPLTGLYDFYGLGCFREDWLGGETFADISYNERTNIFVRNRSHRTLIEDNVFQSFTLRPDTNSSLGIRVSSYIEDWYVEFASGTGLNGMKDMEGENFPFAISPMTTNREVCWLYRGGIQTIQEAYNKLAMESSTGLGTGWTVGPHARLDGDRLILTTGGVTSGCYIYKTTPQEDFTNYLHFQLHRDYDKYILLTMETPEPGAISDYSGYNIWINASSPQTDFAREINPTGDSLFSPSVEALPAGDYINYIVDLGFVDAVPFDGYDPISSLKITLVDDLSGYTINDQSGYYADIRQIYLSATNLDLVENPVSNFYPPELSLINCETETILFRQVLETGINLGDNITGTHYARIHSISGNLHPLSAFVKPGDGVSINDVGNEVCDYRTTASMYIYDGDAQYYDVDNMDIYFDSTGDVGDGAYRAGNVLLPYHYANIYNRTTSVNSSGSLICFHQFPLVAQNYTSKSAMFTSELDLHSVLSSRISNNYHRILTFNETGGYTFEFGEIFNWGQVEYEIPLDEKINLFKWIQTGDGGFGPGSNYEPLDIDNFNSGTNLPKIQVFAPYDHPNCFSIKFPKATFISAPDNEYELEQNISILYGPYKKETFDVNYLSTSPDVNYSGIPSGSFLYPNNLGITQTGHYYTVTRHIICGDENNSEIFWSTGYTTNRKSDIVWSAGSDINATGVSSVGTYVEGDSQEFHNLSAQIIYGDCKNGVPGAIFVHSQHDTGNIGYENEDIHGEAWIKVKIGENIIFDQKIYDAMHYANVSPLAMARGLTAIHETEPSQKANMGGSGLSFVWFERLWSGSPSPTETGVASGWRLHACNIEGTDLWTKDSTGHWSYVEDASSHLSFNPKLYRLPTVVSSSDRYIYLNNWYYPYSGALPPDLDIAAIWPTGGVANSGSFYYIGISGGFINAGQSFAISHDGRAMFPIGVSFIPNATRNREMVEAKMPNAIRTSNVGLWKPEHFAFGGFEIDDWHITDSVKNSDRIPYCPPYEPFVLPTGYRVDVYDTICGEFDNHAGAPTGVPMFGCISGYRVIGSGIEDVGIL